MVHEKGLSTRCVGHTYLYPVPCMAKSSAERPVQMTLTLTK
jgi:hypothetical protein